MTTRAPKLSEVQRAELEAWEERPLSAADFEARVAVPMSEREREDFDELIGWFSRRYPTAGDRLRAIRRRMLAIRRRVIPSPR